MLLLLKGMAFGTCHFIKHCRIGDLEKNMKEGKKRFPKLQIMFVVIQRKGDPAYGIATCISFSSYNLSVNLFIFNFF